MSTHIVDGEVKTPDVGDAAVSATKLAPDAITADLCVVKIGCRGSSKVADSAIDHSELAAFAVHSGEFGPDAIAADDCGAFACVGSTKIADNAVGHSEIAPGAVRSDEIAARLAACACALRCSYRTINATRVPSPASGVTVLHAARSGA